MKSLIYPFRESWASLKLALINVSPKLNDDPKINQLVTLVGQVIVLSDESEYGLFEKIKTLNTMHWKFALSDDDIVEIEQACLTFGRTVQSYVSKTKERYANLAGKSRVTIKRLGTTDVLITIEE